MPKNYRLAKALVKLREEINALYPNRDKSSDGWIGDTSHQARKSDHNPNAAGVVCAIDTDEDLSPNIHSIERIITAIRKSRDKRVNYIIYEGRITKKGSDLQEWAPYHGPSPHNHHAHISVKQDPRFYDDDRPWDIGSTAELIFDKQSAVIDQTQPEASATDRTNPPPSNSAAVASQPEQNTSSKDGTAASQALPTVIPTAQPLITLGMHGPEVLEVQKALVNHGYAVKLDGEYGLKTRAAIRAFQKSEGLSVDGKVGKLTRAALGI